MPQGEENMRKHILIFWCLMIGAAIFITSCTPPEPQTIIQTVTVIETVEVVKEGQTVIETVEVIKEVEVTPVPEPTAEPEAVADVMETFPRRETLIVRQLTGRVG
jgi:hypothetical protein